MKILPEGAELFHVDRWMDRRLDKANCHFFCSFANAPNKGTSLLARHTNRQKQIKMYVIAGISP